MDIVLWVLGLLLAVEALDFLAYITMTSHQHPQLQYQYHPAVSSSSAHSSFSGLESGAGASVLSVGGIPGIGSSGGGKENATLSGAEEDFELIQSHHGSRGSPTDATAGATDPSVAAGTGTGSSIFAGAGAAVSNDAAFAASLSLNDFASPVKAPAGGLSARQAYSSGSSSILSSYMSNRKYGRGSIGMLLLGVYYVSQVFSEVYWRMYFCSFGRRPRVQESMGGDANFMQGGTTSKKGRKLVAHTV